MRYRAPTSGWPTATVMLDWGQRPEEIFVGSVVTEGDKKSCGIGGLLVPRHDGLADAAKPHFDDLLALERGSCDEMSRVRPTVATMLLGSSSAEATAATTPIEAGTITVDARVVLTVEIESRGGNNCVWDRGGRSRGAVRSGPTPAGR